MKTPKVIITFNDRYPLLGPAFWMSSIQYFIIQIAAAQRFKPAYSLAYNTISDLGNTTCGTYGGSQVCSPLHVLMNASFIALGVTMIAGSTLIYREFRESGTAIVGFTFMALAGLGTLLVGLFPENTVGALHTLGASLPFLVGNIGMIILGITLSIPRSLRVYTIVSGIFSLIALSLLTTHHYLSLGNGGMERLTAYPQTAWLIVFGLYMSRKHLRREH